MTIYIFTGKDMTEGCVLILLKLIILYYIFLLSMTKYFLGCDGRVSCLVVTIMTDILLIINIIIIIIICSGDWVQV
jgi:hypothetical protein